MMANSSPQKMKITYSRKFIQGAFEGLDDLRVYPATWTTHLTETPSSMCTYDLMKIFGVLEEKFLKEQVPKSIRIRRPKGRVYVSYPDMTVSKESLEVSFVCHIGLA